MPNSFLTTEEACREIGWLITDQAGKLAKRLKISKPDAMFLIGYGLQKSLGRFPADAAAEKRVAAILSRKE